jgi:peptidoglycan/LPS O-acetylase OafA/YrhL
VTPAPTTNAHRLDLDGLRGVAILLVFAVHSLPHGLPGGFVGVDVFFVLSGYLIADNTLRAIERGRFSVLGFYVSRVRRLGPALALLLLACAVIATTLLLPSDAKALGQHIIGGAAFMANVMLWREAGYFDASSELKPLLHLWSLGVEAQFYLLWPLFAWAFLRWPRRRSAVVAVALLASFILNVYWVEAKPKGTFFLPPTRFWELLVGVQLACWQHGRGRSRITPAWLAAAGLGLLLLALLLIDKTQHFPGWWALLPTAGTALVIAAGPGAWANRGLLSHPVLVFYGRISYPLYLWHWPLLTLPRLIGWPMDIWGHASVLLLAVALAALTTFGIEKPARQGRFSARAAGVSTLALALAALAGGALWQSHGWPERYPQPQRAIADVHTHTDYAAYRLESCFLRSEQGPQHFAPSCRSVSARPEWALWGDSHAAALWPGLEAESVMAGLSLTQWTAAACPPGWATTTRDNAACAAVNRHVAQAIEARPPQTVVLAARWGAEDHEADPAGRSRAEVLVDTVARLRRAGVQHIVVVGPLPQWSVEPPRLLLQAWRAGANMPEEAAAVEPGIVELDSTLRREAMAAGARYVSPLLALCSDETCRLLVPGRRGVSDAQAVAFDHSHLTAAGSRWLVPRLALVPSPARDGRHTTLAPAAPQAFPVLK